jgi:hypothetical protein
MEGKLFALNGVAKERWHQILTTTRTIAATA